jgi:hypothetical protein
MLAKCQHCCNGAALACGCRRFCRIPGCFPRLSGLELQPLFGQHPEAAQALRAYGLENVEAITAVEGIDMTAYSHSDLSAPLGVHLQLEHPT